MDCKVISGRRGKEEQDYLFDTGRSKLQYPDSEHNEEPSKAIDVIPYPIDWSDRERMTLFAGIMLGIASEIGVTLRWGGDWDRDTQLSDNSWDDLAHFEIVD